MSCSLRPKSFHRRRRRERRGDRLRHSGAVRGFEPRSRLFHTPDPLRQPSRARRTGRLRAAVPARRQGPAVGLGAYFQAAGHAGHEGGRLRPSSGVLQHAHAGRHARPHADRARTRRGRVAGGGAASGLESACISLISDLKIRIDLPSERAASGSFLAPKSSTNTAMTISQCQGCRPPNLVTSRRLARVYLPGLSAPTS